MNKINQTRLQKISIYTLLLVPAIVFFVFFFRYTVNAPINDDYDVLDFLNRCISTDSISEKLKLITAQHNEHRIIYDRIWAIISYKLQQNVNFTTLALIGNISLFGIAWYFFKNFRKSEKNLLLFFPVMVLIFNLTSWENMDFAMATLSNFTVYFFMLASLWHLSLDKEEKGKSRYAAMFFFLMAVITQGGGLFLFPVSLLVLLYKKEYKTLIVYGIVAGIIVLAYFYGYQKPQSPAVATALPPIAYIKEVALFAFAFLGNAFNYYLLYTNDKAQSIIFTQIIGGLMFLLFLYITYTQYYKRNPFIHSVMVLLIGSALVTAVSRISFGVETASSSRYRINGIIFAIALYFWAVESFKIQRKWALASITMAATGYFLYFNIRHYHYLSFWESETTTGILLYNSGNPNLLNCDRRDMTHYSGIIEMARSLDTYHFPDNTDLQDYFPIAHKQTANLESMTPASLNANIEKMYKIADGYLLSGYAFQDGFAVKNQKVFIGLKNKNKTETLFFSTEEVPRFDLNIYFGKDNLDHSGFSCRIPDKDIPDGLSTILVVIKEGNRISVEETKKTIIK